MPIQPTAPVPQTLPTWQQQRQEIRAVLWERLGNLPALFTPQPTITHDLQRQGYRLQRLTFENGAGALVYAYLLIPDQAVFPAPAILYNHLHGAKYDLGKNELFQDRLTEPTLAQAFMDAGYIVLCIDAYAFGNRQDQGAAGVREMGRETELALAKQFLWEGSSLWGMMLHDDLLALNFLHAHPLVDSARIGTTGMSLGGSRSTWLAALDERIKVTIPIGQMTRYRDFLATGDLFRHSIYYYVSGILATPFDMEHLASLTAPRPQVILIGDADPLSPISGVQVVDRFARAIYHLYDAPENYQIKVYSGVGHQYTPKMFHAMLAGFRQYL